MAGVDNDAPIVRAAYLSLLSIYQHHRSAGADRKLCAEPLWRATRGPSVGASLRNVASQLAVRNCGHSSHGAPVSPLRCPPAQEVARDFIIMSADRPPLAVSRRPVGGQKETNRRIRRSERHVRGS